MTREEDPHNDNSDESMILSPLYSVILSEAKNLTPHNLRKRGVIASPSLLVILSRRRRISFSLTVNSAWQSPLQQFQARMQYDLLRSCRPCVALG
jgi:hypothetical protein